MGSLCYLPNATKIRDGIGVMYHGQVMLMLILMVKQNDPVTLNKHEVTRRKGIKETGDDYAILDS